MYISGCDKFDFLHCSSGFGNIGIHIAFVDYPYLVSQVGEKIHSEIACGCLCIIILQTVIGRLQEKHNVLLHRLGPVVTCGR